MEANVTCCICFGLHHTDFSKAFEHVKIALWCDHQLTGWMHFSSPPQEKKNTLLVERTESLSVSGSSENANVLCSLQWLSDLTMLNFLSVWWIMQTYLFMEKVIFGWNESNQTLFCTEVNTQSKWKMATYVLRMLFPWAPWTLILIHRHLKLIFLCMKYAAWNTDVYLHLRGNLRQAEKGFLQGEKKTVTQPRHKPSQISD